MKVLFDRIYNWVTGLFSKPVSVRPPTLKREYESVPTQFRTIRGLLESLDETFDNIKLMSPRKSEFQRIIKRFGVYIPRFRNDKESTFAANTLEGLAAYGLPGFICNYIPGSHNYKDIDGEKFVDSFFCAMKKKTIPGIACDSKKYTYYECSDVYVTDKKKTHDLYYVVAVDKKSGSVCPIKIPYTVPHRVGRGRKADVFYTKEWMIPDFRNKKIISDESDSELSEQMKVAYHLAMSFILNYNITMHREYGVNIIVKKGKNRATFTVPQDRWKYFFKERIKVKTRNGNTKPIFHSVSAHARKTRRGITAVKTHYRGLRDFFWSGYNILIVMQGKHGLSQATWNCAGVDVDDMQEGEKFYDIDGASKRLNEVFEKGITA